MVYEISTLPVPYIHVTDIIYIYLYTHLSGAVVSTSDYESAGPSLIPDKGRQHTAHPAVHPPKRVGG